LVERGKEPGLLRALDDLRRQLRCARIAGLQAIHDTGEVGAQPSFSDLVMPQDRRQIAIRDIEQLHEPVLELDVVMRA
jgi:hypothetical protein